MILQKLNNSTTQILYRIYTRPKVIIDFTLVIIDFSFMILCKQVQVDLCRIQKVEFWSCFLPTYF